MFRQGYDPSTLKMMAANHGVELNQNSIMHHDLGPSVFNIHLSAMEEVRIDTCNLQDEDIGEGMAMQAIEFTSIRTKGFMLENRGK